MKKNKPEAMRFDSYKLRFDLIPQEVEIELARVYTVGAQKYDDNNWRKGMKWSRCHGSLRRHLAKFMSGKRIDPETGCHHLSLVAWNALTLMVYDLHGIGEDDRVLLDIDEEFQWTDNPDLGLNQDELKALRLRHAKDRK